jgi:mRNA deadenylase 3'-5' endonuclease subunit Ccr4
LGDYPFVASSVIIGFSRHAIRERKPMPFSVASYNILADAYIRREWYPKIPQSVLDPQRRTAALVRHLEGLSADVIWLQEVEPAVFTGIAA